MPPSISTAEALRRVFSTGNLRSTLHSTSTRLPSGMCLGRHATPSHHAVRAAPPSMIFLMPSANRGFSQSRVVPKTIAEEGVVGRDEGIGSRHIRLVDPVTNSLSEQDLYATLQTLDRNKYFLVKVAEPRSDGRPLCKIMLKKAVYDAESKKQVAKQSTENRRKGKKSTKRSQGDSTRTKIIEIGWGISKGDLDTKLQKLAGFLSSALTVEVVLQSKKRARRTTVDEAKEVLTRLKQELDAISSKIVMEEGLLGGTMRLMVEPSSAALEDATAREARKVEEREAKKASKKQSSKELE